MNTTTHYALHIDDLRISKGLTVHELCEGICDDSTYRRYKTGKKDIPIYKIKMFCDKLELDWDEFLSNTMSKTSVEYKDKKCHTILIMALEHVIDAVLLS